MKKMKQRSKIVVGKCKRKSLVQRHRYRLKDIEGAGLYITVDWINLCQDIQWYALVNVGINLHVSG
jgi:hypothetical protein